MKNVMDILRERGFIKQTVYEEDLYKLLGEKSVTFYIGFDPTADSLHVGHFVQLMAMAHMQRAGHKPIALIGGGTAMVGDPSGRTDMRSMMTRETIAHNCECFKKQMERFVDFSDGKALMVNNADWLLNLNYVDFLREIGTHFSVNKMLTAECFKKRLEKGLSFLEFNYMLMQGYDFLVLYQKYGCLLELGGDDQWSNMLAGADLIRRKEQKDAFAMTFSLLTTSEGTKMGKTAKGAVWLDAEKTTPYEFFQYWRNVADADVEKCLKLLTFVDIEEIKELCKYNDERINQAKVRLAYEVTALVHGKEIADTVKAQVEAAFSNNADNMQSKEVVSDNIIDCLVEVGFAKSKGEARRLIEGGGVSVDDTKVSGFDVVLPTEFILHKGKKAHLKVVRK
ncbi:MAG: tyrosine--tRNA ligase [Clostridiales bacterium]|nr:tyrosine--tRNA ligase [Eubacteriales bacterium]MDD6054768.1 tyrosine--tRNA ligase [Clostridiales bacterium]MDD7506928.1 tyrosine--tRNA ligase [Clostridiales bacterium]MDY5726612.1 tyrosine--tRNA ligase [Eubacteriales bacterium]